MGEARRGALLQYSLMLARQRVGYYGEDCPSPEFLSSFVAKEFSPLPMERGIGVTFIPSDNDKRGSSFPCEARESSRYFSHSQMRSIWESSRKKTYYL